ncbi:MAG TPA: 16S rRNA (cytosine(1402)-N(4))-methyltransferase RsmH [Chloroflexota bacterium]|nr:16S rRNA (cytosine(1402)-N(4))-methyltransferase RsmH [Chloroflexota bacterium]
MPPPHRSVLLAEVLDALGPAPQRTYVDCTVGAGGHAEAILEASAPDGFLVGMDADRSALEIAGARLSRFGDRVRLEHANYREIGTVLARVGIGAVDGILFDLGVSSMQLDQEARGFSFQANGPLDMRMNPESGSTAADLVNSLPRDELTRIIADYGEERFARRIASSIVDRRRREPFHTTRDLASAVSAAIPGGRRDTIHPATRTFQALRIAVNRELEGLEQALPVALAALNPGGRVAVISFHSLEDRIVKRFFQDRTGRCVCPPALPVCRCDAKAEVRILTKKPVMASVDEQHANPRSRSAKLRVVEKLNPARAS